MPNQNDASAVAPMSHLDTLADAPPADRTDRSLLRAQQEFWRELAKLVLAAKVRVILAVLFPIRLLLATGNPHATIDRLFKSRHVKDLQLIMTGAFILTIVVLWFTIAEGLSFLHYSSPVIAVFGLVLAWVYQIGSARLGVVDLFACEISTLCRISTIFDTVHRRVEAFEKLTPEGNSGESQPDKHAQSFTSQENYFPVFDNCARDLQTLEAQVVINITAFYTYMKALRDSFRQMADIGAADQCRQRESAQNALFLLFLAMESARRAIKDLVEFQPEYAERSIVILISELEAWRFLCPRFTNENIRYKRLMLRKPEYEKLVPDLYYEVERYSHEESWRPAAELLSALKARYEQATGRSIFLRSDKSDVAKHMLELCRAAWRRAASAQ